MTKFYLFKRGLTTLKLRLYKSLRIGDYLPIFLRRCCFLLLLMGALAVQSNAQTKYFVNADGGNDTNDGLSWVSSFKTLQKGIETTVEGDSIWVAKGVYVPSVPFDADNSGTAEDKEKTFYINKNIKLYGGFVGTEIALSERMLGGVDTTFLDGILPTMDSAYHVVYIDGTSNPITNEMILDGFTVRHGRADGVSFNRSGGAIFNNGLSGGISSPSIVNATFYNNSAKSGGAIFNIGLSGGISSPSIVNATFYNNSASSNGGAINNVGSSGGISSPSIVNATFYNNSANSGGAILNSGQGGTSNPSIVNATFYNNLSLRENSGGGAINNQASGVDGISSPSIVNATFYNNSASTYGGAILNSGSSGGVSSPSIVNATFYNNLAISGGAILNFTATPIIQNSIFWNNKKSGALNVRGADIENVINSTTTITHSLTQENSVHSTSTGILNNQDPQFADAANGDFRLLAGSPAIDMGDNTAIPMGITTDLGGNMRIQDGMVDMGAFEGGVTLPKKYHVNAAGGDDTNDGLSWNTAFATLQKAIETTIEGDSIWVAKGVYVPSVPFDADNSGSAENREKTFYIDKNIKLYGGFVGTEIMLSERILEQDTTFLDGALSATDSTYHVLYIDGTSNPITNEMILDGFTVRNGRANGGTNRGGAIFNNGQLGESSPSIVNATFYNNLAKSNGGAIYNDGVAGICNPIIINATFYNNSAAEGGAIHNEAESGISNPIIRNTTFYNNSASSKGGAIHSFANSGSSSPSIMNSTFYNNSASEGGAISNFGLFSSGKVNLNIVNSTFYNNLASGEFDGGGAIAIEVSSNSNTSSPSIVNTTFYNNSSKDGGAIQNEYATLSIQNAIFWGNKKSDAVDVEGADISSNSDATTTITHSLTQENSVHSTSTGILNNQDPQFADAANGDFRLLAGSPAIDMGDNTAIPMGITTDLGGNMRIQDGTVDMGAFEGGVTLPKKYHVNAAGGDDTNDGLSWNTAFATLQKAIETTIEGDSIWVAKGVYVPSVAFDADNSGTAEEREKTFYIDKNIKLYGGFSGTEIALSERILGGVDTTFLDGALSATDSAYHVLYIDGRSTPITNEMILDGITIRNGRANGPSIINRTGGAIYNNGQNGTSSPSIVNATFYNNSADLSGGAILNGAYQGTSSPSIVNATFYNNSASNGGAVFNDGYQGTSSPSIVNATFYNNSANEGGAIYNYGNDGGTSSPSIINATFYNNSASQAGAINNYRATPTIKNAIFWNNKQEDAIDVEGADIQNFNSTTTISYSLTQENSDYKEGTGILNNQDPQFANAENGDFRLLMGSPAIDAGTTTDAPATDILGITRPQGMGIDMGAYEFEPSICPTMVNAGADTAICNSIYTLQGTTLQTGETGQWTFVTNLDDKGTLTNPTSSTAKVNVNFTTEDVFEGNSNSSHTVTLQWKVTSENCPEGVSDTVVVTLNPPVSAGVDRLDICGTTIPLGATPASDGTGNWSFVTNPNTSGTIADLSKSNATLTGTIGGIYELEWMVTGGVCNGSMDRVMIAFQPDSDNDTFQDCVDLCEGGDDNINSDNTGMPDDCDCAPFNAEGEFVLIASSDLDANASQNPLEMIADFQLTSDAIVKATPTHPVTIFQAGNNIVLAAGFHAQAGSDFTARIGYCKEPVAVVEGAASSRAGSKNIATIPTAVFDLRVQPNLIQSEATIFLDLSITQDLTLVLYDQTGQLVRTFLNRTQPAGSHQFLLRTDYLASGMYLLQLRSATEVITKKVMVQR